MPDRRQAIIWTRAGILFIRSLGINFSEIFIHFHSRKCIWKCLSAKCRPFCLGLNEIIWSNLSTDQNVYIFHWTLIVLHIWQNISYLAKRPRITSYMVIFWDLLELKPEYTRKAMRIKWLRVSWIFATTNHEHAFNWLCRITWSLPSMGNDFNNPPWETIIRNENENIIHISIYKHNSVWQGLKFMYIIIFRFTINLFDL